MNAERKIIHIRITDAGQQYDIKTHQSEYRNLMTLLNDRICLEGFGECGGQGRCATCLVAIAGLTGSATSLARNEKTTIDKMGLADSNLRLACHLFVTEYLHETTIDIYRERNE